MFLYVITNLANDKQYVGITGNPKRRWRDHQLGYGSKLVYQAIKKYGIESFEFNLLCEGPEDWIKFLEIKMIISLNTKVPKGYNITDGGDGTSGIIPSLETRRKMSEAAIGKVISIETRRKMSEVGKGRLFSVETRKKLSKASKGRVFSVETRKKLSAALKGKSRPLYQGAKHPSAVKVIVNDVEYGCLKDAAKDLKVPYSTLCDARRRAESNMFTYKRGESPKLKGGVSSPESN